MFATYKLSTKLTIIGIVAAAVASVACSSSDNPPDAEPTSVSMPTPTATVVSPSPTAYVEATPETQVPETATVEANAESKPVAEEPSSDTPVEPADSTVAPEPTATSSTDAVAREDESADKSEFCDDPTDVCDSWLVNVSEELLTTLRAARQTAKSDRTKPIQFQKTFLSAGYTIRVSSVSTHELSEDCGSGVMPASYLCTEIELEITSFDSENEDLAFRDEQFSLVGGSGTVYNDGPEGIGLQVFGKQGAGLPTVKRLVTRVARFVFAEEKDMMLVYHDDFDELTAFWLAEDVPYNELDDARDRREIPPEEVGHVGSWTGNAVPFGNSHVVDHYEMRVVEFERGWQPQDGCCPDGVPKLLLTSENGDEIKGFDIEAAVNEVNEGSDGLVPFEVETEYVRVRFTAENMHNVNWTSTFYGRGLMLVDDKRRIFKSGFLPGAEKHLRASINASEDRTDPAAFTPVDREAVTYGGGIIEEEMAWLVPKDASGLTLVYLPDADRRANGGGRAGFFALEDSGQPAKIETVDPPSWVDDALGPFDTWDARPAPLGRGAQYGDDILVRVSDVERIPSTCYEYVEAPDNEECLRVELEIALVKPGNLLELFGNDELAFVIDGEIVEASYLYLGYSFTQGGPNFQSLLDWMELNGRGYAKVSYTVDVPRESGPVTAIYVARNYWDTNQAPVFLALSDSVIAEVVDQEHREEVAATVTAVAGSSAVGIYEFLDGIGNGLDDFSEDDMVALTGTTFACADYIASPTASAETVVFGAILGLSETSIGPVAASYFDGAEDAAVFCAKRISRKFQAAGASDARRHVSVRMHTRRARCVRLHPDQRDGDWRDAIRLLGRRRTCFDGRIRRAGRFLRLVIR